MICVNRIRVVNPKTGQKIAVPCGRCYACQQTRRSAWMFRNSVELQNSACAYFVTLTYNDENLKLLPKHLTTGIHMPIKSHYQRFLKRLRKRLPTYNIRYFLCHEYGEQSFRPHYHMILYFNKDISLNDLRDLLRKIWYYGNLSIDYVNDARIHYMSKYICKQFRNVKNNDSTHRYIFDTEWTNKTLHGLYQINYFLKKYSFIVASQGLGCQLLKSNEFIIWFWNNLKPNEPYPTYSLYGHSYALPRIYLKKLVPSLWSSVAPDMSEDSYDDKLYENALEANLTYQEYVSNNEYIQKLRLQHLQSNYKVISKL